MGRSARAAPAEETVEIAERGSYRSASGREVGISDAGRACLEGTRFYTPARLAATREAALGRPAGDVAATVEVVDETTPAGLRACCRAMAAPWPS